MELQARYGLLPKTTEPPYKSRFAISSCPELASPGRRRTTLSSAGDLESIRTISARMFTATESDLEDLAPVREIPLTRTRAAVPIRSSVFLRPHPWLILC